MNSKKHSVLIPAFNPDEALKQLVNNIDFSEIEFLVIVNDGSDPVSKPIFETLKPKPQVVILEHCVNLGKGAALKTGLNYLYLNMESSNRVVTADADGQHLASDIKKVGKQHEPGKESLILGTRSFTSGVPLRSAAGNVLTKHIFRLLTGVNISDTQTGLRSIPKDFIPALVKTKNNGYEFELDMLLESKRLDLPITQVTIQTVYIDNNKSSHFNPIIDSLKIYFTLLRFAFSSVLTALIDFLVFLIVFNSLDSILLSQYAARLVAGSFNFTVNRNLVFKSSESILKSAISYILLVISMAIISHGLILFIIDQTKVSVIAAKILAESLLFLCTFAIQREFIFSGGDKWTKK